MGYTQNLLTATTKIDKPDTQTGPDLSRIYRVQGLFAVGTNWRNIRVLYNIDGFIHGRFTS